MRGRNDIESACSRGRAEVVSSSVGGRIGENFKWPDPDFATAPSDTSVIIVDQAFWRG